MARKGSGTGLNTSLVGRVVKRDDSLPHCWPTSFVPNVSGEWIATVVAAWVEDNVVRVAIVDPFGHCGDAWLSHVLLVPESVMGGVR